MSAPLLNSLYLVLVVLQWATAALLVLLNSRSIRNHTEAVPPFLQGCIGPEKYRASCRYSQAKLVLEFVEHTVIAALLFVFAALGLPGVVASLIDFSCIACQTLTLLFLFGLPFLLLSIMIGFIRRFVIEERFGFNESSIGLFMMDSLKRTLLSITIAAPVAFAVLSLMRFGGPFWWLWAALFLIVMQLGLSVIYPAIIAPLFNSFTPLPDGSLRDRVTSLADSLGFPVSGVYVMDASRRSTHGNAYFTGIGRSRRIVIYDTLVSRVSEDEVLAVFAHEIGHRKLGHVPQRIIVSSVATLTGLFVLSLLLGFQPLFQAFGFETASEGALMVLAVYFSGPIYFFLAPIFSMWSRRQEFDADKFAVRAMGSGEPLRDALLDLSRNNLINYSPSAVYAAFYYSHPVLAERLAALGRQANV